jgi:uncharacterized protein
MKRVILAAVVAAASLVSMTAKADMGVSTGATSGTYYAVASDIQRVCKGKVEMKVYESAGSLSNLERVFSDPKVQYGIVQEDALVYKQLTDADLMKRIKMVFPLYREEIQLVALTNGPKDLAGFAGKKIAIGTQGSGSWVTGQMLSMKSGVDFTKVEISQKDGLDQLANGQVDGVLVVGGKPFPLLKDLGAFANGRIKLVPISSPGLDGFYKKAMIPEGIYAWQKTPVQTYSVQSMMATFDYKSPVMQKDIGAMVKCVKDALPELQVSGHTKWREVDLGDFQRVQWPVHPAALRAINGK